MEQTKFVSTAQLPEQPSPARWFPSSQASPPRTSPSPQTGEQKDVDDAFELIEGLHVHPDCTMRTHKTQHFTSILQMELQPSALFKFLSSQTSAPATTPSEQIAHTSRVVSLPPEHTQDWVVSTVHCELHPSPCLVKKQRNNRSYIHKIAIIATFRSKSFPVPTSRTHVTTRNIGAQALESILDDTRKAATITR